MLHTTRSLSKFMLRLCLVLIAGCSLLSCSLVDTKPSLSSQLAIAIKQRVYFASYDSVWRAAHSVLKYPIAQENQDNGVIETEYIKGIDGWLPPDQKNPPSNGIRYKLVLTFAKGHTEGRESTLLTIDKKMEILRDFFSPPEPIESDGLEEKVIFYRIERELIVSDALKRAGGQ